MGNDHLRCRHCGKLFADPNAVYQHHKKKHRGLKLNSDIRNAMQRDKHESIADRAVYAALDHAMGIHNDDYDWLIEPYK